MKIKICGLTRECDIEYVNEALPDYIGFVFAKSRREISATNASKLRERLSEDIAPVGVFVDCDIKIIKEIISDGIIDVIQLHGGEDDRYIAELKSQIDAPIIKAIRADSLKIDFDEIGRAHV